MINFRKYIDQIAKISDKDWQIFSSKLEKREFPKKSVITSLGQIENYISDGMRFAILNNIDFIQDKQ